MSEYGFFTPALVSRHLQEILEAITRVHGAQNEYDRQKALAVAQEAVTKAKTELSYQKSWPVDEKHDTA